MAYFDSVHKDYTEDLPLFNQSPAAIGGRGGYTVTQSESLYQTKKDGITSRQELAVLSAIQARGAACIAEVAHDLGIDKSSVSRAFNGLIKKLQIVHVADRVCPLTNREVGYYKVAAWL